MGVYWVGSDGLGDSTCPLAKYLNNLCTVGMGQPMTSKCKGCDGVMAEPVARNALSRYGHGYICSECGLREALEADFIGNKRDDDYSDMADNTSDYADEADALADKVRELGFTGMKAGLSDMIVEAGTLLDKAGTILLCLKDECDRDHDKPLLPMNQKAIDDKRHANAEDMGISEK